MTFEDVGIEGPAEGWAEQAIANQAGIFKGTLPGALGVRIVTAGPDGATGTMEVGPNVLHPGGYAHGGALAGFGDTVAAWATFPTLARGEVFTTIEFKANFISGVRSGRLFAEARPIHRGRRTMVLEVRITTDDAERKIVAVMLVTQAIISGKARSAELPPEE